MAVTALRPNPRFQAFDLNGDPLAGGKLYTYSAGTTAALATYTDSTGVTANANPVILDSRGEASVWFQPLNYKLILKDSSDNTIWTQDNYSGSPFPITDEWITYVHTWTYISATQVSVPGDQTAIYTVNKAVRAVCTGGTYYGTITASAYDGSTKTTLTVSFDTGSFDSGVSGSSTISIGVQSNQSPALTFAQTAINAPGTSATSTTSLTIGTGSKSLTVQTAKNFVVGMSVKIAYTNSPTNWMHGDITAYDTSTGALTVEVADISGSGTQTAWTVSLSGVPGADGGVTAVDVTSGSANITLTSSSDGYQSIAMTATGKHVSLPDATGMTVGGPRFVIKNDGGYPFGIRDNAGTLVAAVAAGGIAYVTLKDAGSAAGSWSVIGDNLEPGLITIDSTFSSTYSSTVLAPFVALDSNTSIHFASAASGNGFMAFVVDNTGKIVGTPVTVATFAGSAPRNVFRVSATSAIVFSSESKAYVLTVSGTTITVGTGVAVPNLAVVTDDFTGPPKIVQLSPTLYLASYVPGTNTAVTAISVSGSTVTVGAEVNIIAASSVANSTTTYALTATTALVLYKSGGGAPYANNAVVISVSGTTCTVGTPAALTSVASSATGVPASCQLSATKVLVGDNNNTAGTVRVSVFTISGTTVTAGTGIAEPETGTGATFLYTDNSATRYNPHLFPLSSSTALLWYLDSSGISRAVVLSESGGTVTAGTILRGSFSQNSSGSTNFGAIGAQGTSDFISVVQTGAANSWRDTLIPHKISGTTITYGSSHQLPELSPTSLATALPTTRLSQGDYLVFGASASAIPVFRTNGDSVNKRGAITLPYLTTPTSYPLQTVSSNRIVLLGATFGTTVNPYAASLRSLTIEVCA